MRAPGPAGASVQFVALPAAVVTEQGDAGSAGAIVPLVELERPYRAEAHVRDDGVWVVGARRIAIAFVDPDPGGSEVVVVQGEGRVNVTLDGSPTFTRSPVLERLGRERAAASVVTARRVSGATWEVEVAPL